MEISKTRQLLHLPTFILMWIMRPTLPVDHPFRDESVSLRVWTRRSTALNTMFSAMMWYQIIMLFFMAYAIWS